jgi:hypothetical protein
MSTNAPVTIDPVLDALDRIEPDASDADDVELVFTVKDLREITAVIREALGDRVTAAEARLLLNALAGGNENPTIALLTRLTGVVLRAE